MIQFFRGLRSKYAYPSNSVFTDALYFATDTGELLLNGKLYGIDGERLKNVEFDTDNNIFTFTKQDDSTVVVNFGDKLLTAADRSLLEQVQDIIATGNISVMYDSQLDESVTTVNDFGGIKKGTTVAALKVKTISQVLDDLIFPTVNPTLSDPSASLSLKSGYSNVQEVGAAAPNTEGSTHFTATFNQGSIKIGSNEQAKRAGAKTSDIIYYTSESTAAPSAIVEGTMNYYYKVYYAEGPQPKDSKGNNYGSPLAAGSKTSSAVAIYGVYKYYAGTGSLEALSLSKDTTITFTLGAEGGTNKHQFAIPAKYTLTKVEVLNTLNNEWVNYNISSGLTTSTTTYQDAAGTDVSYKVYTRNDADLNGSLQYRITFTK